MDLNLQPSEGWADHTEWCSGEVYLSATPNTDMTGNGHHCRYVNVSTQAISLVEGAPGFGRAMLGTTLPPGMRPSAATNDELDALTEGTICQRLNPDGVNVCGAQMFGASIKAELSCYFLPNCTIRTVIRYETVRLNVVTVDTFESNAWYHVVFSVNSSGNAIYVDGIQQAVSYITGSAATSDFLDDAPLASSQMVGCRYYNNAYSYLGGGMDDARLYSPALTSNQIYELAVNDVTPTNTLYFKWDFDGSIYLPDLSDNQSHVNLGLQTHVPGFYDTAGPSGSGAFDFEGEGNVSNMDYINVPGSFGIIKTIAFWLYLESTSDVNYIVHLNTVANPYIRVSAANAVLATGFPDATIYVDGAEASIVQDQTWHRIVVVDQTGVDVDELAWGRQNETYYPLRGMMAQMLISSNAWTSVEIEEDYYRSNR